MQSRCIPWPINVPGPAALIPALTSQEDLELAKELVCAYSKYDRLVGDIRIAIAPGGELQDEVSVPRPYDREKFKEFQIC